MRVLVRNRDQSGAVALLVALLSVVLFGIAAFVVDLGSAYSSKRQLQTGADAAALAGAAVYAQKPGTCASLLSNAGVRAEAQAAADGELSNNFPQASGTAIQVTCPAGGGLEVTYVDSFNSPTYFAGLFGVKSLAVSRLAAARDRVPPTAPGLRPYGVCDGDANPATLPSAVIQIGGPGNAHGGSDCPEAESGGNWWNLNCPEDPGSSDPNELADQLTNGCSDDVTIVTGQDPSTPATLSASLTSACHTASAYSSSCLSGDTGNNLKNSKVTAAWDSLLGKTIIVPVFCSTPTCNPDTVQGTGGSGTHYPIYKLASVEVCGFHIYNKDNQYATDSTCASPTYNLAYVKSLDKAQVSFFFRFVQFQVDGGDKGNNCDFGNACDGGLRGLILTR
jgi:hypothetical protein